MQLGVERCADSAICDLFALSQLSRVNESLSQKAAARNEYDVTISETEAAFMKILESSQTLLHVLKRESVSLVKKRPTTAASASSAPAAATPAHSVDPYQQQQQQQQQQSYGYAPASSGGSGGYVSTTRTK